jgi:type I restriction enzyme S subunit
MSSKAGAGAPEQDIKRKLTPKLRFPEFRDAGPWEKLALSSVLNYERPEKYIVSGTNYQSSGTPVLTANKSFVLGHTNETTGIFAATPVIIFDDFTTDKKYVDFPFKVKSSAIKILKSKGANSLKVIFELMGRLEFNPKEHKRYYISEYQNLEIALPQAPEQQKIADCLSSLDDMIAAQARKVEALTAHKKGLMQQLFPREGEALPRMRFPEFWDAPVWESRELGPMTRKVGSGITPLGGDKNYKLIGRPFIRSQNVGWGELMLDDVVYIDEETHRSFGSTEIEESDVLLNITGASIGRSAVADSRIVGGNVNQHVCIIRLKQEELNPVLLNQYLISNGGQKQIDSFQAGGNRQGLNFGQIRSFQIPFPPTGSEQKRIADCLSSIDDLIDAESQILDALGVHKKALMQQLFPSPEGVEA